MKWTEMIKISAILKSHFMEYSNVKNDLKLKEIRKKWLIVRTYQYRRDDPGSDSSYQPAKFLENLPELLWPDSSYQMKRPSFF